jgi:hypothetical protein
MSSRAFFSLALLLPVMAGLTGLLIPSLRVLIIPVIFGGVPYIPFAALLLVLIRRASKSRLKRLSLVAPVLFLPFVLIFVIVAGGSAASNALSLVDTAAELLPFVVYGLLFGYLYVGVSWLLWAIARGAGLVRDGNVT